jgi:hypothetical protein
MVTLDTRKREACHLRGGGKFQLAMFTGIAQARPFGWAQVAE